MTEATRFHRARLGARALAVGILVACSLAAPAACASRGGGTSLIERRRAELDAADRAWSAAAARRSAVDGIAAMLADDVRFLQDGEPILRGRDAARASMLRGDDGALVQTWTPARVDVSVDGRFGYSYGFLERRPSGAGDADAGRPGKYIAVWRRGDDGDWRAIAYVRADRAPGGNAVVLAADALPADALVAAAPPATADAREAAIEAARDADRRFSAAGSVDLGEAFAFFAAPDAALLGPGASLILGPAAIRAAFAGRPAGATLVWHPVDAMASDAGDLAFTVGEAESRNPATGAVGLSKYLTVWRRQADGSWRYVVDGGNARPAPGTGGPKPGGAGGGGGG